jgi:zinc transporter ZupT
MSRRERFESADDRSIDRSDVSGVSRAGNTLLAWLAAIMLAEPVASAVIVGILFAAAINSVYGFLAGAILGVVVRQVMVSTGTR